jgi:RNA polymerase sigma-70 factor (ECF subfamily)
MNIGITFQSEDDADDHLIISQIISGQGDLFRLLVRRHERAVYGMGISFFRNREDASDFTQEVFLKVYRSLSRFEGKARFSTWLYKIAYNTAINRVNRNKEYLGLATEEGTGPLLCDNETPARVLIRQASRQALLAAMEELPERYRACVDLFFFYDRSYQEIEVITGFPVNTIKSHVFRAKKILREKLEGIVEIE